MSVRLLTPKSSLLTLVIELRYTLSRCKADPRAQSFVPTFQPLRDQCTDVQLQELALAEEAAEAQAAVDMADENIDDFSSRLSKAVLVIVKDDRNHPLYLHFFGNKSLSVFQKPKLGAQLTAMAAWVTSLETSPFPALQAMAPELVTLIQAGQDAIQKRTNAQAAIRQFRDVGARRQLFDAVNGARKSAEGALTKLAIDTPGMPRDFSSRFFRSAAAEQDQEDPTIDSVKEEIADLESKLKAAQDLLTKLEADAQAEQAQQAQAAADAKALADLEKQEEDLKKQKADLLKKLGKK
jgi:uncharacterized phage infection (PIP) family protein YhgE